MRITHNLKYKAIIDADKNYFCFENIQISDNKATYNK